MRSEKSLFEVKHLPMKLNSVNLTFATSYLITELKKRCGNSDEISIVLCIVQDLMS